MLDRETRDLERLHEVLDFIQVNSCQVMMLAAHFSDHLAESCGHCSWCTAKKAIALSRDEEECSINDTLDERLTTLLAEYPELSNDAESIVAHFYVE